MSWIGKIEWEEKNRNVWAELRNEMIITHIVIMINTKYIIHIKILLIIIKTGI